MQKQCVTLHGFVTGRVQGVFFRAETRRKALELGLNGWVKNLADGRVELLVSGPAAGLDSMRTWLQRGPPLARVDNLNLTPVKQAPQPGFYVAQ